MVRFRGTCWYLPIVPRGMLTPRQPWITPSIFESTNDNRIIDEYTLGQYLGPETALNILQDHWKTVRQLVLLPRLTLNPISVDHRG